MHQLHHPRFKRLLQRRRIPPRHPRFLRSGRRRNPNRQRPELNLHRTVRRRNLAAAELYQRGSGVHGKYGAEHKHEPVFHDACADAVVEWEVYNLRPRQVGDGCCAEDGKSVYLECRGVRESAQSTPGVSIGTAAKSIKIRVYKVLDIYNG